MLKSISLFAGYGTARLWVMLCTLSMVMQCAPPRERSTASVIPYPQPKPDTTALTFLPEIVSSDSLDFNAAFSPDGKSFFFSRSPQRNWEIFITTYDGEKWSEPEVAPFSEKQHSQADATFGPDGFLYYISNRPKDAADRIPDFDIWRVREKEDGTWTTPENVPGVNSDSTEYYVSLAANGNLYFASTRAGGLGDHDIYVSRLEGGKYLTPENLGPTINSPQMEHDPCIAPDEKFLFFTSVDRKDSHGSGDIYYSLRSEDRSWSKARNAGSMINTATYEYCSYLTPDGMYYFFSSDFDVKWIAAEKLLNRFGQ